MKIMMVFFTCDNWRTFPSYFKASNIREMFGEIFRLFVELLNIRTAFASYLEPCALTGSGLLLHRHNLQNLIFQCRQEEIDDFKFLSK